MFPKAYLTSHSWMSGSRWVITPLWLSGSWRSFLYSSSVYSCQLFLISYASVRSIPFLSFIMPIFAWNVPLVSLIFLKRSLVFPILLFSLSLCTDHWGRLSYLSLLLFGTLHSNGYIFPVLLCLSLHFFSQLFVRPLQITVLSSLRPSPRKKMQKASLPGLSNFKTCPLSYLWCHQACTQNRQSNTQSQRSVQAT